MIFKKLLPITLMLCFAGCGPAIKTNAAKPEDTNSLSPVLKNTVVIPIPDEKISTNKSTVYCSTFQLAWNELRNDIIKDNIKLSNQPDIVDKLNKGGFTKNDLSPESYIAMAGFNKDKIIDKINAELKNKFSNDAPFVENPMKNPDDIFAYSCLIKNNKFTYEFKKSSTPIKFNSTNGVKDVSCFGINKYDTNDKTFDETFHSRAGQVSIYDYKSDDDFVIKLDSDHDDIVLAKTIPSGTISDMISTVEKRIDEHEKESFLENDVLEIPVISFSLEHSYDELCKKAILNKHFTNYEILIALQTIEFKLDNKGAYLKSQAKIGGFVSLVTSLHPKKLIFDKPFFLYMKQKNSTKPYLAMWVNDPEQIGK